MWKGPALTGSLEWFVSCLCLRVSLSLLVWHGSFWAFGGLVSWIYDIDALVSFLVPLSDSLKADKVLHNWQAVPTACPICPPNWCVSCHPSARKLFTRLHVVWADGLEFQNDTLDRKKHRGRSPIDSDSMSFQDWPRCWAWLVPRLRR